MIDLDALIALRAVAARGSVVAAAAALGFTPSAISQQIKRLERQTGVTLLERVGRGVILTGEGRQLAEQGSGVLRDLESLESSVRRMAGVVSGPLRLGAFSTAMRGLVAPAAARVIAAYPQLRLGLVEVELWDAVEMVAAGQLDVAVVHSWGDVPLAIPEHLASVSIGRDVADVLVHRDHRLARRRRVRPADLRDEPWVATPDGSICREWLHRMYLGTGRLPDIAHQCSEFQTQITLVAAGLGVALVPRLGRGALPPEVVAVGVHDPEASRELSVIHRHSLGASPSVGAVTQALLEAARL